MEKKMSAAKAEKVLQSAVDETDATLAAIQARKDDAQEKMERAREAAKGTPLEHMFEDAEEPAEDAEVYRTGHCRFCGAENHTGFESFETQAEADDFVTACCTCSQAARARARREEQDYYKRLIESVHYMREQHADERAEIAQSAMDTINQLFGTGAQQRGTVDIDDEVIGFLHAAAMLVYDGMIGGFSTSVAPSLTAKITCKKQVLAIERCEATKQKLEVL